MKTALFILSLIGFLYGFLYAQTVEPTQPPLEFGDERCRLGSPDILRCQKTISFFK